MANIKVKDLTDTSSIALNNQLMVLTNDSNNLVQNITVDDLLTNVLSTDSDNVLEKGNDGKLYVETPETITGKLSNLTTTNKSTLVGAINEVDGDVGNLANLTTSVKTNVVNAINSEVSARGTAETNIQNDYNGKIGTLSNLDTTDKSNIVGAINEIAAIAEPSLQYEPMNNSKALETGAPSENAIILADIQKYAHSTFDSSKFTVVGSPIITDDGIASGFSSSNYITSTFTSVTPTQSIILRAKGVYSTTPNAANAAKVLIGCIGANSHPVIDVSDTQIQAMRFHTSSDNATVKIQNLSITDGDIVEVEAIATSTSVTLNAKINGTSYTNTWSGNGLYCGAISQAIASSGNNWYWTGSIDLKQFSITVDGVEVFSGNKTGIDTIKPDDYTIVGTPTISADGVASGFSISNYLKTGISTQTAQKITLKGKFNSGNITTHAVSILIGAAANNKFMLFREGSYLEISLGDGSSYTYCTASRLAALTANTDYEYIIEITPTQINAIINGTAITPINLNGTATLVPSDLIYSIGMRTWVNNGYWSGSIDLNAFKIYVDGNLVYQPCLKIPYTLSHSGSKIADAIYRDRVVDAYEQGYEQRYYTLSETDFTLPMGEIYGDIENCLNVNVPTLAEKAKVVSWGCPDLTAGISIGSNATYTTPSAGWLYAMIFGDWTQNYGHVYVNTVSVGDFRGFEQSRGTDNLWIPVDKGDSVVSEKVATLTFYPVKGAN